jgi:tetratricopeptide (TPR) repeat protein/predicted Ser/Thr protein kinase
MEGPELSAAHEAGSNPLVGAPAAPSSPLPAGSHIDRYEIHAVVGSGGGGTVYRARDGRLGRDVSLKLLHAASPDMSRQAEARGRLFREAQALARLSHPNVVAAYDVGTHEGALFITMEFIEGTSMRDWLAQPRRRVDVLRTLIAAGRGLVAAHESGVLHRDFKPANVMVSSDRRVRVVDFGLARPACAEALDAGSLGAEVQPPRGAPQHSRGPTSSHTISRTGGVVGTPGFIPPEQWRGEAIDHRSDQFSYAVTAFVALTGQLPYPEGVEPIEPRSLSSTRTPWPRSVPRALRRIVERGLSARPEDRYPSLAAMVDALEPFASPGRRASRLAIGAAFAASVALSGALPTPMSRLAPCNVDDAALAGVWDANQRERMAQAFLATGKEHAGESFALISQRLDLFRSQWLAMRRDSCEATLVRREQDERVMVLRAACLDRALEGTQALVGALVKVDAANLNRVAEASPASVTGCADAASLLGTATQLPADPALRAIVDEVEVGLVVNQALVEASGGSEAVEHARRVVELARTAQHEAALAKATAQLGRATLRTATAREQRVVGETILNESLRLAALAGDDQLLARTASFLFYNIANAQTRIQDGEAIRPMVEAFVRRAGNPALPRIELLYSQNTILVRRNKVEAAAAVLEEAIRLAEANVGTEFQRLASAAAGELGHVYFYLGKFAESVASAQRGVEGMRRVFGPHHPRMLVPLANLATLRAKTGHLELALETLAEYRALTASMPPNEPRLMWLPLTESRVWRTTGHCDRAVPLQREALAKFAAAHGPDHPLTTNVMSELGVCLAETHHVEEAISFLERALVNRRDSHDDVLPDAELHLAQALWQVPAQRPRARALAEKARAFWVAEDSAIRVKEADEWLAAHPP